MYEYEYEYSEKHRQDDNIVFRAYKFESSCLNHPN